MSFEIIPQAPNYEINGAGVLRNRKTKKVRKWSKRQNGTTRIALRSNKKMVYLTQSSLLWQLHGLCTGRTAPIAASINKGTRSLHFDSLTSCSKFLAKVTPLTFKAVNRRLSRRHAQIADWQIRYIDPKANPVTKGII